MNTPHISVVTSAYNSEQYIAWAIESVLNQTYADLEFILVDDGSKDRTWEIITAYSQQDSRIIPLRNEVNLGVVRGLNRGLEAARGAYIARQDADDIASPQRFELQLKFLQDHPDYGVVASRVTFIDSQNHPFEDVNPFESTEDHEIQEKLLDHMCLCGPTLFMRRESLEAAGFWFGEGLDASEDYDLCLRLAEVTRMASLPERHYLYRIHPQSATRKREFLQALHKAVALENAVNRRFCHQKAAQKYRGVARDYLWASLLALQNDDLPTARQWLAHALKLYPTLLGSDEPLKTMVDYRNPAGVQEAVAYLNSIFVGLLPRTPKLKALRSQMISSAFMKEVFTGVSQGDEERIHRNLWPGLKHNPLWLFNRGVLVILSKNLLSR